MHTWLEACPDRQVAPLITDGFEKDFNVPADKGSGCSWSSLKSVLMDLEVGEQLKVGELKKVVLQAFSSTLLIRIAELQGLASYLRNLVLSGSYTIYNFPREDHNDDIDRTLTSTRYQSLVGLYGRY